MIINDRKKQILELLNKNGTVTVAELSSLFEVSEVTVRNYLTDMESKGLLTRTHGGAISSYKTYYSMNFNQRLAANHQEKEQIAQRISEMIEPDDTIFFNSGTTTLYVFRCLPSDYNLNIVTNSVSIALEASTNPNFNIILIGGSVNSKYQFTHGSSAIKQLEAYHADKVILSVDGIDFENGISTHYNSEATIDAEMIKRADVCILAADHSKLRRNAFVKIADLSVADYIVTACEIDEEETRVLSEHEISFLNVYAK